MIVAAVGEIEVAQRVAESLRRGFARLKKPRQERKKT